MKRLFHSVPKSKRIIGKPIPAIL